MFKFIHAADLHLDSPLRGIESYPDAPVEQIRTASRRALDNLVDMAIEEEVAFVLLAGDVYDGDWKDYNTGLFLVQRMGRLREAGIKVFLISGNHDSASVIAKSLRPPENVHVFSNKQPETYRLDELGVAVHGQGYQYRETRDDLAVSYPPAETGLFNIGLLHTALTGRPGHEPYAPCSVDVLKSKGYDYWALGHVHKREVVSEEPWIVFSGNIQGRHIREAGPKGCSLVTVEEGRVSAVEHREIDVLRWHECVIDLDDCDRQEDLFHKLRHHLEAAKDGGAGIPLAVRLILRGKTSLHTWLHQDADRWTEECRAQAAGFGDVWMEKIKLETGPKSNREDFFEEGSPLAGLFSAVKDFTLSTDICGQIPELSELKTKLPSEITSGEEPLDFETSEVIEQVQEDVRELLITKLMEQGRGE